MWHEVATGEAHVSQRDTAFQGAAEALEKAPSLPAHSDTMPEKAPLPTWFKDSF
jgi:hypothetical protein